MTQLTPLRISTQPVIWAWQSKADACCCIAALPLSQLQTCSTSSTSCCRSCWSVRTVGSSGLQGVRQDSKVPAHPRAPHPPQAPHLPHSRWSPVQHPPTGPLLAQHCSSSSLQHLLLVLVCPLAEPGMEGSALASALLQARHSSSPSQRTTLRLQCLSWQSLTPRPWQHGQSQRSRRHRPRLTLPPSPLSQQQASWLTLPARQQARPAHQAPWARRPLLLPHVRSARTPSCAA